MTRAYLTRAEVDPTAEGVLERVTITVELLPPMDDVTPVDAARIGARLAEAVEDAFDREERGA